MPRMNDAEPSAALPDEATLARVLREARIAVTPAELHGSLCGYLAGGGRGEGADWLQRLQIDAGDAPVRDGLIDDLRDATLAQFASEAFELDPLLPAQDAPLAERAEALLAWCRGFLGGFGLADAPATALDAEASEALQDIARIASSDLAYSGSEEDEDALDEIIDYVRIVPLLIHAGGRRRRTEDRGQKGSL